MSKIDQLIEQKPFDLAPGQKEKVFLEAMKESVRYHYNNCGEFRSYCDKKGFGPDSDYSLQDIPFLPVSIFKKMKLISVDRGEIIKSIHSSSTTGSEPSRIYLDKITSNRQIKVLNLIMSDFIGPKRKLFIVFDNAQTASSTGGDISSRGSAIRGMMYLARKVCCILDKNLDLDMERLTIALKEAKKDDEICFFGFTFLFYRFIQENKGNKDVKEMFTKIRPKHILHIGGWKKLKDLNISKEDFNQLLEKYFGTKKENIIDFYGMTEQLGTVYPDCKEGFKHVPVYSDIIIRDTATLKLVETGKEGFIQLLTPIPHSYPGASILTEDIGYIYKEDGCACGRRGKIFRFKERAEKAEIKGCGDTIKKQ